MEDYSMDSMLKLQQLNLPFFERPHRSLFFWTVQPSKSPCWLVLLLALSGDIHPNPGPYINKQTLTQTLNININTNTKTQKEPKTICSLCLKPIYKNHTSFKCNKYQNQHWIHKKCSLITDNNLYNNSWICPYHSNNSLIITPKISNQNYTKNTNSNKNTYLRILQININGIQNKITELILLTQKENIDVITIQESKLTSNTQTPKIPFYTAIRKDRNNKLGGGLLTYIKENISFTENNIPLHLNNEFTEIQSTKIHLKPKHSLNIINLYLPPPKNKKYEQSNIENVFSHILTPNTIITADINAHSKIWHSQTTDDRGKLIENLITISDHNILNTNTPTRIPPNKQQQPTSPDITTISNNLQLYTNWKTLHELSSDHLPILTEINTNTNYKITQNKITYTNYNKANWIDFTLEIENNIKNITINDNVNTANHILTNIILKADKHHIPKGRIKTNKLLLPSHITQNIKLRNEIRKTNHTNEQINILNKQISKDIENFKKDSWTKKLNENWDHKINSHILWKTIKTLSNKYSTPEPNKTIKFEKTTSKDSQSTANLFNKQFTSTITHKTNNQYRKINKDTKHMVANTITLTTQQITNAIKNSKDNNSTGPDNINIRHLKHLGPLAINYLTILFNNSLNKNIIPQIWKTAKIIPIPKPKKDTNLSSSYRPISLLSPIAKTLEKTILPYITNNINNIEHQHGFKKHHSTTTALHHINNSIIQGFDHKKPHLRTLLVALDMSKAFDTVNIHRLINKIKSNTNIPPTIIKFTANYLKGRQGFTLYNNKKSKQTLIKTGVPQGGVLSPTLFNIYMSDMPTPPIHIKLKTFADDISIYTQHTNYKTAENNLQPYLLEIQNWTTINNLKINSDKSTSTLFTKDPSEFNKTLQLDIDNSIIPTNTNPKILGLTFDPKLTYSTHIDNIQNKANKTLNILKALSGTNWGKHKETLITTYKTITRPIIEYASTIWSCNTSHSNLYKLETIQNNALRIATGCTKDTNTYHLHSETNILPIETHLKLHASQQIQKSYHPTHPLNTLNYQLFPKTMNKENIFNPKSSYITHRKINLHQNIDLQINTNIKNIHTNFVKKHIQSNSFNKLLNKNTPTINKSEQSLNRDTRRTLAQLRINKSPFLNYYLNKINPTTNPTPNCPLCLTHKHTTQHLFECKSLHTDLKPIDLWTNPVSVSRLLATWSAKMAGLTGS